MYRKFPQTDKTIGYTGQSLLVIVGAILQICLICLIFQSVGYALSRRPWKLTLSGIGVSTASICFRSYDSRFILHRDSIYYIETYNVTSICLVIGLAIWIPFGFCKSDKYAVSSSDNSITSNDHRSRITTTGGHRYVIYRPSNDEPNTDRDELPSYYEMISPPAYKSKSSTTSNRQSARLNESEASPSSPRTSNGVVYDDTSGEASSRSNIDLVDDNPPPFFTANPTIIIP